MNELEHKIIATAIMAEQEERELIFRRVEPEQFEDAALGRDYADIRAAFFANPKADGLSYLSAVSLERQREIVMVIDSLVSPTIATERLPDTLNAFAANYREREIRRRISDLALGSPTAADVTQLAEDIKSFSRERVDKAREYLDSYVEPLKRIASGFSELDRKLSGGFIRGTLSTIGARPSTGKTTYAINIATHNPSLRVLFVSVEMSARMIYDRIISDKADVDYGKAIEHDVLLDTVRGVLRRYENLTVVDDVSDVEDIVELIHDTKPDLVVVDYIQIVTSKKGFENNRQRIDYISRSLKTAGKQTGAHIMSLSQITRGGKDKPTMSDLKESGGLEQDSDYIILLYREYVNDKSDAAVKPEPTIVTLDKNKFGSTGEFDMDFNGGRQRFEEAQDVITRPARTEEAAEDEDLPF